MSRRASSGRPAATSRAWARPTKSAFSSLVWGSSNSSNLLMDEKERRAGLEGATPRTIEGPLYITDAPLSKGEARLDQDPEEGLVLFMGGPGQGRQRQPNPGGDRGCLAMPTPRAATRISTRRKAPTISVAGSKPTVEGRYRFRSIMPSGYGCSPDSPTQELLSALGRHGQRPAHIHFFVEAPGYRKLTTQINIAGDEYLHDDFAFATREGLIPDVDHHSDPAEIKARGLNEPFATIQFDFTLNREAAELPDAVVVREHAKAA